MALHPDVQQLLDQMATLNMPDFADLSVEQARGFSLVPEREPTPVAEVRDGTIAGPEGDVPVRVYRDANADGSALVYFHGGGWVIGGLDSHDESCRLLARDSAATVVSVDYRLAPETRYPGAAEDCYAALLEIAAKAADYGIDPSRIAVGGDSAGGNLAAAVSQMARDRNGPGVAFQLLIYPVTDADFSRASYSENAEGYFLTKRAMQWFWDHYVPEQTQRSEPYAAPLRAADLTNLPPALVITAEYDPLRDEGEAYAAALETAGNSVTCTRYDGVVHGFFGMQDAVAPALDAIAQATDALRQALGSR